MFATVMQSQQSRLLTQCLCAATVDEKCKKLLLFVTYFLCKYTFVGKKTYTHTPLWFVLICGETLGRNTVFRGKSNSKQTNLVEKFEYANSNENCNSFCRYWKAIWREGRETTTIDLGGRVPDGRGWCEAGIIYHHRHRRRRRSRGFGMPANQLSGNYKFTLPGRDREREGKEPSFLVEFKFKFKKMKTRHPGSECKYLHWA